MLAHGHTRIQKAIDYTEAHLTEEIDYDAVAKEACSSSFHFQRVFSIMCGFTLGDYIRMRRLSLAADELRDSSDKVIDIALKYGYETPESFFKVSWRHTYGSRKRRYRQILFKTVCKTNSDRRKWNGLSN